MQPYKPYWSPDVVLTTLFYDNFSAGTSVTAGLRTAMFKPAYELYACPSYEPGGFMSTMIFSQMQSATFSTGLMQSAFLPGNEWLLTRSGTGANMDKGNPPTRGDDPNGPKDPRGHWDPENSGGPSGNESSGAPQPLDGGDNSDSRGGGGPPNGRVPGGQGGSPGPPASVKISLPL